MLVYITRRYNTIPQYIVTRSMMEICGEVEQRTGSRVSIMWEDQEEIDFLGLQVAVMAGQMEEIDKGGERHLLNQGYI